MLQVKGLTYRNIIKNITFNVEKESCVSLIDKNGSGKSTLLKCIAGILKDFDGEVLLNGKDLKSLSMREIAQNVAYVPQLIEKKIELKVREFLELSLFPHQVKITKKEALKRVIETAERLGIEQLLERRMCFLSGGEVQKVLISGAVIQGVEFILLDEPTSHLDIYRKREILDFILNLKSEGKTLIFVSHNLEEVRELSDRVIVLSNGEIAKTIDKSDINLLFDREFQEFVYA